MRTKLQRPIDAEIKFHFLKIESVSEEKQEFDAHVRIDLRINKSQIMLPRGESYKSDEKKNLLQLSDGKLLEEFKPKLQFKNLKIASLFQKWTHVEEDSAFVTYEYDINGTWSSHIDVLYFPIDAQLLFIHVSSDWDVENMVIRKHELPNKLDEDQCFELKREFALYHANGTEKQTMFSTEEGASKKKYRVASTSVMIIRKRLVPTIIHFIRPCILGWLGFTAFYITPVEGLSVSDDSQLFSDRMQIILVLLLAANVTPIGSIGNVFTLGDLYAALTLVILFALAAQTVFVWQSITALKNMAKVDSECFWGLIAAYGLCNLLFIGIIVSKSIAAYRDKNNYVKGNFVLLGNKKLGAMLKHHGEIESFMKNHQPVEVEIQTKE